MVENAIDSGGKKGDKAKHVKKPQSRSHAWRIYDCLAENLLKLKGVYKD